VRYRPRDRHDSIGSGWSQVGDFLVRSRVRCDEAKRSTPSEEQKRDEAQGRATGVILSQAQNQFVVAAQRVPDGATQAIADLTEHLGRRVPILSRVGRLASTIARETANGRPRRGYSREHGRGHG